MKNTYVEITKTSIPLILSSSGLAVMQFFDAMFLSRHSPVSLAAAGSAGCISWTLSSFLLGMIFYTAALTSNYIGARMEKKVGKAIWQGIYISIASGIFTFFLSFFSKTFFIKCGHNSELALKEGIYLQILLIGGFFYFAESALSGFFSGRKDNTRLMLASIAGQIANLVGDYILIFGKCGFPEMGVAGGALATVGGSALSVAIMSFMFLSRRNRVDYATWKGRSFDWGMMKHIIRFGAPKGLLHFMGMGMYSLFLIIVGRIGDVALASSTAVSRLNTLALLPVIGIVDGSTAFIGEAHGRRDHKATLEYMWKCAILSAAWMIAVSVTFVLVPDCYLNLFFEKGNAHYNELMTTSRILLYFVSLYCTVDSFNVSLSSALQTVGDTRWTSYVQSFLSLIAIAVLVFAGMLNSGLYTVWTIFTIYVMLLPPFWIWRIRKGNWKNIVVAR